MAQYADALGLPLRHAGKVRELYDITVDGTARVLMVATDNISAFDHVLSSRIPDKGRVLTQLSLWWFAQLADIVDNHVVSTDVPDAVAGRAVVVEALEMIEVECVARGYLTGSGWVEYQQTRTVCGVPLPDGLVDGDRLPEPIFTPAIKAPLGSHDENVDFDTVARIHGEELANRLLLPPWLAMWLPNLVLGTWGLVATLRAVELLPLRRSVGPAVARPGAAA